MPRNPARMKIINARSFDCCSFDIRKIEIQIRKNAIILFMKEWSFGIIKIKIGASITRIITLAVEPAKVRRTA